MRIRIQMIRRTMWAFRPKTARIPWRNECYQKFANKKLRQLTGIDISAIVFLASTLATKGPLGTFRLLSPTSLNWRSAGLGMMVACWPRTCPTMTSLLGFIIEFGDGRLHFVRDSFSKTRRWFQSHRSRTSRSTVFESNTQLTSSKPADLWEFNVSLRSIGTWTTLVRSRARLHGQVILKMIYQHVW